MHKKNLKIPRHVALIMDGNGRWATQRRKTRNEGHSAGTNHLRSIIKTFFNYGISHLSFYGFSTENWKRPKSEISGIFSLLTKSIDKELNEISDMRLKVIHIGDKQNLPMQVTQALARIEKATEFQDPKGTIALAFNYGSRAEIVHAAKNIVNLGIGLGKINQKLVNDNLYTNSLPDVDLLIRTGGEKRLSNFLLWQSLNAKLMTTETLWPDFTDNHVKAMLKRYNHI